MIDPEDLNRQLASASAMAFVLLAGGAVAATAGSLSSSGIQTMVDAMVRYWTKTGVHDLNQTVGLSLDQIFGLLYAKFLPEDNSLLGLFFPLHTPLIRVRQDMTHFMRLILDQSRTDPDPDWMVEQSLQSIDIIGPIPDPELHQLPGVWELEITDLPEVLSVDREKKLNNLNKQTLPTPDSKPVNPDTSWYAVDPPLEERAGPSDWRPLAEEQPHEEDLVSILQGKYQTQDSIQLDSDKQVPLNGVTPSIHLNSTVLLEDTQPYHIEQASSLPEPQIVSDVTFYLVPASQQHFLIGELAAWLKRWMPVLCETYGWQLGLFSVRPDYIKWTLEDFPESLIQRMLVVVRQQTSERIFRVFPNLKTENYNGDFWAPGYLVDTQSREFTTQALMVHLAENRLST